jgi:hypothetical protein
MKLNLPLVWWFDVPREADLMSGRLRIVAGVVIACVRGHTISVAL